MAERSVGNLNIEITADGSAAIRALEQTADAVKKAGEEADRAGDKAKGAGEEFRGAGDKTKSAGDKAKGAGEEFEGAGDKAKDAGKKAEDAAKGAEESWKKLGDQLTKAGEKMTKFVTLPVVAALTASVKGAADLTETVSKTEVVFDRLTDRVMDWSETSIEQMGLAQGSALEMASTFGDMGKGMGLELQQATEMSMNLTQLAADLASFKNIRSDVAAQKLNAIYTGETEGLKSLGIVMTQTNLSAFALAQGITKPISAMTQAEQVMLRYQYVMNATKDAQGDFARTGDSLSNQSRKLTESVKQLGESFGSQLIPLVTPIVEKIQQFVQHIAELDSRTKNIIISVAMVAAAIGPLLLIGGKLITFLATLKAAMTALSINPVMLILAAVAAATLGVIALTNALNGANKQAGMSNEKFQRLKDIFDEDIEADISVNTDDLDSAVKDLNDNPPEIKTLHIGGEAAQSLLDAQKLVHDMEQTHYGKVVVNGETEDVDKKIGAIRNNIDTLARKIRFTSDGKIYLDGDAEGNQTAIDAIKAQIAELEAVVPFIADEEKRAQLETLIGNLKQELTELEKGAQVEITLSDGGKAINDAKAAIEAMEGEHFGTVTVNGRTEDVDEKVRNLGDKIRELDHEIKFDTDGNVYLEDGSVLTEAQQLVGELEAIVEFMPPSAEKDALQTYINNLKSDLSTLTVSVEKVDINPGDQQKLDAFADAVKQLDAYANGTYKTTADFETTGMNADEVKAYGDALVAALNATKEYDKYVADMDRAVENIANRKRQELQEHQFDQQFEAYLNHAAGLDGMSDEQYLAELQRITDEGMGRMAEIDDWEANAKAQNAILKDGKRSNDIEATDNIMGIMYEGMSEEELAARQQTATENAYVRTGLGEGSTADALRVYNGELENTAADIATVTEALAQYNQDRQSAEDEYLRAQAKHEGSADEIETARQGYARYQARMAIAEEAGLNIDPGELFEAVVSNDYDRLRGMGFTEGYGIQKGEDNQFSPLVEGRAKELLKEIVTDDEGEYLPAGKLPLHNYVSGEWEGDFDPVERMQAAESEWWKQQKDQYESANLAAGDKFTQTISGVGGGYNEKELDGAMLRLQNAGVEVPQVVQDVITGTQEMAEAFANDLGENSSVDQAVANMEAKLAELSGKLTEAQTELANGSGALSDAAGDAVQGAADTAASTATSGGESAGENLPKGLAQGIRNSTSEAVEAGREMARQVNEAVKGALKIQSPSKVMRDEVGVMIPRGIVAGVKQEEPDLLKAVRGSADKLVSGAASVVSRPESYRTGTGGASTAARMAAIDYDAMGKAMGSAVSRMRFGFHVGANELSEATREADARALAVQTRRIANSYGG